jgi:eukaryotic-like serine/threonine-protein kinase
LGSPPEAEGRSIASGGDRSPEISVSELFETYLEDYFAALAPLSMADLPNLQEGFYSSLAFGAAGIAYAHWYAYHLRGEADLLDRADTWIRAAQAGQRRRLAFVNPAVLPGDRMPEGAFLYGRTGLSFVRALIARSGGDRRAERRALARFAELSRLAAAGVPDFYIGSAGCLAATAILYRQLGSPALGQLGSELSAGLLARAVADERGHRMTWQGLRGGFGLAHGTTGVFLALLLWSAAAETGLPDWFAPSLKALLDLALGSPERFTPLEPHRGQLCKGLTGPLFLAARAAAILREPSFLTAARALAARALAHLPAHADLCCGRSGFAFALLPLAAQDPAGPWRKRARDLALSTLLCEREDWELTGLYGGEAALPCLALGMTLRLDSGPPCLDFIVEKQTGRGLRGPRP